MLRKTCSHFFAFLLLLATLPALAQTVNWTLSSGNNLEDTEEDEDIENWDSDIINITVAEPGVLSFHGHGTRMEGTSGEEDTCGGTRVLSGGWFPQQNSTSFSLPVRAGDYSIKLAPHGSGWVHYRVQSQFAEACEVASGDDHGNSPLCATEVCIDSAESAVIGSYSPEDYDYFSFVLASTTSVTISTSGATSVDGEVFDENGESLALDDDGTFSVTDSLGPGRFFVKIWGHSSATGSYSLLVAD
jgi:hypothetical protein